MLETLTRLSKSTLGEKKCRCWKEAGGKNEEVRAADEAISWSAISSRLLILFWAEFKHSSSLPFSISCSSSSFSTTTWPPSRPSGSTGGTRTTERGSLLSLCQLVKGNKPSFFCIWFYWHSSVSSVAAIIIINKIIIISANIILSFALER